MFVSDFFLSGSHTCDDALICRVYLHEHVGQSTNLVILGLGTVLRFDSDARGAGISAQACRSGNHSFQKSQKRHRSYIHCSLPSLEGSTWHIPQLFDCLLRKAHPCPEFAHMLRHDVRCVQRYFACELAFVLLKASWVCRFSWQA
jgi:hypothetical protein